MATGFLVLGGVVQQTRNDFEYALKIGNLLEAEHREAHLFNESRL